jgi:hypothetical protein
MGVESLSWITKWHRPDMFCPIGNRAFKVSRLSACIFLFVCVVALEITFHLQVRKGIYVTNANLFKKGWGCGCMSGIGVAGQGKVQNWVQKWAINVLDLELNLNVVSMR